MLLLLRSLLGLSGCRQSNHHVKHTCFQVPICHKDRSHPMLAVQIGIMSESRVHARNRSGWMAAGDCKISETTESIKLTIWEVCHVHQSEPSK